MDGGRWIGFDGVVRDGSVRLHSNGDAQEDPLCIGRVGGLDDVFGGRGRVRRCVAQGEPKCSGGRFFALASELVRARDERDDFLCERVGVAPGDRRRALLLVLRNLPKKPPPPAASSSAFVAMNCGIVYGLDVAAAVQRSQLFEQVVLVGRREKCREEDDVRECVESVAIAASGESTRRDPRARARGRSV